MSKEFTFNKSCHPVEHGIPLPKPGDRPRKNRRLYPLERMKVGDSFSMSKDERGSFMYQRKRWVEKHPEHKYRCFKKLNGNLRVWRVE